MAPGHRDAEQREHAHPGSVRPAPPRRRVVHHRHQHQHPQRRDEDALEDAQRAGLQAHHVLEVKRHGHEHRAQHGATREQDSLSGQLCLPASRAEEIDALLRSLESAPEKSTP